MRVHWLRFVGAVLLAAGLVGRQAVADSPTKVAGFVIVWTGNTLSQTIAVTGGMPVRIWVHA